LITFEIREDGKEVRTEALRGPVIKVGSINSAHLSIGGPDTKASRMHAYIQMDGDNVYISDLGSAYGTIVNGQRVNKAKLKKGDVVTLGDVEMTVVSIERDDENETINKEVADEVLKEAKTKRRAFVYYCENCFHIHGKLLELVEGDKGKPECPECKGEWKLNRGQARHVVTMKLAHYAKLAAKLGLLDDMLDEETLGQLEDLKL
jgi:pSer/pThr/pTyr-binding forkhead associated (FHA) protein